MIAVDTNIIVRLLVGDHAEQTGRARTLFEQASIFIPKTVLFECEWVLRRLYKHDRLEILDALERVISLANVQCEDEPAVRMALTLARTGLDFTDTLHLSSCKGIETLITFDEHFVRLSNGIDGTRPKLP